MQINGYGLIDNVESTDEQQLFGTTSKYSLDKVDEASKCDDAYSDAVKMDKNTDQKADYKDVVIGKSNTETDPVKLEQDAIDKLTSVVTAEDYSKYAELGLAPDKDDPTTLVTVSDRINIELATYCDDYVMYGDISMDKLKDMYGDRLAYTVADQLTRNNLPITQENADIVKNALDMAQDISSPTQGTISYILKNELTVSIENVYIAGHSNSDSQFTGSSITDAQWKSLLPQVNNLLKSAGLSDNQQNLDNIRWMMEQKIPVTAENIQKMAALQNMSVNNSSEMWIESITSTMSVGGEAADTLIVGIKSIKENVQEFTEIIDNASDNDIWEIIGNGDIVNMNNLKDNSNSNHDNQYEENIHYITAKRQLEEIRLIMTADAGIRMVTKGIDINTESLENIVKELKTQEDSYAKAMFANVSYQPDDTDIDIFKHTNNAMETLKSSPAYVLGMVENNEINLELQSVADEGNKQKLQMEAAGDAYETMQTQPRKDLGDSIQTAFQSTANILQNLDMEDNDINERAVRILSYNNIEVTKESIESIKSIDMEVSNMIDNMTPKTVAYLIKNGINPLNTDIRQLNDELDNINEEIDADPTEKYSEFLWKLQKDSSFTDEERSGYIGVYRLLNMIQKGDRRVIGAMADAGTKMTLNNMVSALQSEKSYDMNVSVDESTGIADEVKFSDNNIVSQLSVFEKTTPKDVAYDNLHDQKEVKADDITPVNTKTDDNSSQDNDSNQNNDDTRRFYEQLLKQITNNYTPWKFNEIFKNNDILNMSFEQLAQRLSEYSQQSVDISQQYYGEKLREMQSAARSVSEDILQMLMDSDETPSVENAMTAQFIMSDNGKMFGRIKGILKDDKVDKDIERLEEFGDDEDEMQDSYDTLYNDVSSSIDKWMSLNDNDQIHDLLNIKKSLKLMKSMSDKASYNVPVEIDGETANIRVTIITDGAEKGKVNTAVYTKQLGHITAEFKIKNNAVDGIINTDSEDTARLMRELTKNLESNLKDEGFDTSTDVQNIPEAVRGYYSSAGDNEVKDEVSNRQLYRVAKIFITNVKEWSDSVMNTDNVTDK